MPAPEDLADLSPHQRPITVPVVKVICSTFWLYLGTLLCVMFHGGALASPDRITEKAWFEDPTGQLTWPEVQHQKTQSFSGMLNKGFGTSAIWVRMRIDPGSEGMFTKDRGRLLLRIRPVYLDHIQVFDPLTPNGLVGTTGDTQHPRLDEFQGLDFLMPIARGAAPRDVWLRLTSSSTRQLDVQALEEDELNLRTRLQQLVFAGYIGLILVFAVWAFVYWLFSRDRLIGTFCLTQTAAMLYALGSLGYMRVFWPVDWSAAWLDQSVTLFSITAVSTAVLFHVLLIREFSPPRWMQHVHKLMLCLLPVKLALLTQWPVVALEVNMTEVLLSPLVFLLSIGLSRAWSQPDENKRPPLSRPVMLGFYCLLLGTLALASLAGLGLAKSGEISLHIVQMHGLVTAFFVLLMLQYRAHVLTRKRQDMSLALAHSQLEAHKERQIREEQDKLLTMLAHELKTPLSIMTMRLDHSASGSRQIRQAIRDMDNVIERCLQTTQLGERQLSAHFEPVEIVSAMRDVMSCSQQPGRLELNSPVKLLVQTDRQLLSIVLNNLLENACKYAAPGTRILLSLQPLSLPGSHLMGLQLEVANVPGPAGWPDADKVFNKYYRSPNARRQAGTGLGLFLVRNLVHILGGRIDYVPDDSRIRFRVQLPMAPQAV